MAQHRIVCAAVKLRDGQIICGVRHFDALMLQAMPPNNIVEGMKALEGHVQGFVDTDYQFRDRSEAWRIALRAHQVDPRSPDFRGIVGSLHSEDLY